MLYQVWRRDIWLTLRLPIDKPIFSLKKYKVWNTTSCLQKRYFMSAEMLLHVCRTSENKHNKAYIVRKFFRHHHSNCGKDEKCQKGNWSYWKNVKKKKENGKKHRNSANTLSIHYLFRHAQVLHTQVKKQKNLNLVDSSWSYEHFHENRNMGRFWKK